MIVLAHGLMGGTTDLSFLKDCILELDPRALVLLSRSNQDRTTVWHGVCTYAALNLSAACVCVWCHEQAHSLTNKILLKLKANVSDRMGSPPAGAD